MRIFTIGIAIILLIDFIFIYKIISSDKELTKQKKKIIFYIVIAELAMLSFAAAYFFLKKY